MGTPLRDPQVVERIAAVVEQEGADAWFTSDKARFLAPEHDPEAYDKVTDILDVWFESGTTHSFVLEQRPELMWPASLYLEGSDQHRGWFHSSLLESCGTRGRAPYDAVLTHGFVVDGEGRKMSKSLGNVIAPQQVNERYGADILRALGRKHGLRRRSQDQRRGSCVTRSIPTGGCATRCVTS